jgi:hypothetical protein
MRKTVGALSIELLKSASDNTHSAHEQMQEQLSEYDKNIEECISRYKKLWPACNFYAEVQTRGDRMLRNVIRHQFFGKRACPTPTYDQAVYFYNATNDSIEFLWVLPSQDTCIQMRMNALSVPSEERELLQFVLEDADGTLLKKVKMRNKEPV